MADYFGHNKQAYGPGSIVSAPMVMLAIDNTDIRLVQGVDLRYSRGSEFKYELGSESVYTAVGQSSGTCNVSRAVGDRPMLAPYKPSSACSTQELTLGQGHANCGMNPGMLKASGCMLTDVTFNVQAGGLTVTDGANWTIGSLTDSN